MGGLYVADFETTVYEGQTETEVWAAGLADVQSEELMIYSSIEDFFSALFSHRRYKKYIIYFHNLKFDGNFILSYFMRNENIYKQGLKNQDEKLKFKSENELFGGEYIYTISDKNVWYKIVIKKGGVLYEFRDSLKLMPFTLAEISSAFKTEHRKLNMEYRGLRKAGGYINLRERHYLTNDLLVLKEALIYMLGEGHSQLTIGACALHEYKKISGYEYNIYFRNLAGRVPISDSEETVDDYIRKSYKGGWCYLKKGKENKVIEGGITLDVNSLYPYVMSSNSGNRYPVYSPTFWEGNFIPKEAREYNRYFFIRIRTRFYLKPGKLPTVQIKDSLLYNGRIWLETSDVFDRRSGKYYRSYITTDGDVEQAIPTLTLTMVDYYLLLEHYDLEDTEILSGCYFETEIGIFDDYIEKYKKIKENSTGARRTEAKLFLNNLYGKMATSSNSSFRVAHLDEGIVRFEIVRENSKKLVYIPVGAAITSYARNYIIRAAQRNYERFIYSDTDSLHCQGMVEDISGLKIDKVEFGAFKVEREWGKGLFVRQKTYIEVNDKVNITCAGMPPTPRRFLQLAIEHSVGRYKKLKVSDSFTRYLIKNRLRVDTRYKKEFLRSNLGLEDFKVGLSVPGCLKAKTIKGGIVLNEGYYEMRKAGD